MSTMSARQSITEHPICQECCLEDIEALLSSHRLAFDTLAIEAAHAKGTLKDAVQVADFQEESRAAEEALRLAYERLTQQEAAMQAEREEAHAEIAELHEQLTLGKTTDFGVETALLST